MKLWEKKCSDVAKEFFVLGLQDLKGKTIYPDNLINEILENEYESGTAFGDREKDLIFLKNNWDIACYTYELEKEEYDTILNPFEDLGKTVLCLIENKMIEMLGYRNFMYELCSNEVLELNDTTISLILDELGIEHEPVYLMNYER